MSTYFSTKIKALRRSHELTQEQMADIFHVSPQTVSRWETGANYPDIEILPHIAVFFNVTVDELLGTQQIAAEENAKAHRRDIRNLLNAGNAQGAVAAARNAMKEYPQNFDLQSHLMHALCTANAEQDKDEIIQIGEKVIEYCKDQTITLWTTWLLIRQYVKWDMKEQAKKLVYSLPAEAYYTQELTLKYVLEGEEWLQNQVMRIERFSIMFCDFIGEYMQKATLDIAQKIEWSKAIMQIEHLTNQICGEEVNHITSAFHHVCIAEMYCEAGDAEQTMQHVELATQDAMHHTHQMDQTTEEGNNYYPWPTSRNLCWILWEDHLMKSAFDFVRSDERFGRCFDKLKENARQLQQP
ncbi:MAG: helix-turn-helix domain-containing protein [Oscillospiraceae bacterium]|nr:helix-turn-helix domain-containing protein [Oscillospiraceae bacterium]